MEMDTALIQIWFSNGDGQCTSPDKSNEEERVYAIQIKFGNEGGKCTSPDEFSGDGAPVQISQPQWLSQMCVRLVIRRSPVPPQSGPATLFRD